MSNARHHELFLFHLLGNREIGVAGDEVVSVPLCPEMQAFLNGCLLTGLPSRPSYLLPAARHCYAKQAAIELAAFLRGVACVLDPTEQT